MFFYTASYLQYYQAIFSVVDFVSLLIAITLLVAFSIPQKADQLPKRNRFSWDFAYAAWYRDVPLWQAFWPCWIGLNCIVFLVDMLAKAGIASVLIWDTTQLLFLVVSYWWCVAVWRTSSNTCLKLWAFLARLVVIATFLEIAHRVFIRVKFPRDFFNCNDMFFNFTSCF